MAHPDSARDALVDIIEKFKEFCFKKGRVSEADTRAKVIDRVLKEVCGWPETDLKREYKRIDYLFSMGVNSIVVESKSEGIAFALPVDGGKKRYKLAGALATDGPTQKAVKQVNSYCVEHKIPYAIATNGYAWIVFRASSDSCPKGHARVFPTLEYIRDHFTEFWNLLSYNAIEGGALKKEFASNLEDGGIPIALPLIAPSRLKHGAEHFVGRDNEIQDLNRIWCMTDNVLPNILVIVGWGGVGKTSLVVEWKNRLAREKWRGAEWYFDWSFYGQGSGENSEASADEFLTKALRHLGDNDSANSKFSWGKGQRLAELAGNRRGIVVLDGLEPLQDDGRLKRDALRALLVGLAQNNRGLCIVTTRQSVADLVTFDQSIVQEWHLEALSPEVGIKLLKLHQVHGDEDEMRQTVRDVQGHALTLDLLGRYLRLAHGGDIKRRDRISLLQTGKHAFHVMEAYENWMHERGKEGQRELAILRLMGLFDLAASPIQLAWLIRSGIRDLTDSLYGVTEDAWNIAINKLQEAGLLSTSTWFQEQLSGYEATQVEAAESTGVLDSPITFESPQPGQIPPGNDTLTVHPLVREYFAKRLRSESPKSYQKAQHQLYSDMQRSAPYWPISADGMRPLLLAVIHGNRAGQFEDVYRKVLKPRIFQYCPMIKGHNRLFSMDSLGLWDDTLSALSTFFDEPWQTLHPSALTHTEVPLLFTAASMCLRTMCRFTEAIQAASTCYEHCENAYDEVESDNEEIRLELMGEALRAARMLGQTYVAAGDLHNAKKWSERSLNLDGDSKWSALGIHSDSDSLSRYGEVLHNLAEFKLARIQFEAAEKTARKKKKAKWLDAFSGYEFCDFLLTLVERGDENEDLLPEILDRASFIEEKAYADGKVNWQRVALARLIRVRALVIQARKKKESKLRQRAMQYFSSELDEPPFDMLRTAGQQQHFSLALLAEADLACEIAEEDSDRSYLRRADQLVKQVNKIVDRSTNKMRLHLLNCRIIQVRLAFLENNRNSAHDRLEEAKDLLVETACRRYEETISILHERF